VSAAADQSAQSQVLLESIVAQVVGADPHADVSAVRDVTGTVVATYLRRRRVAKALTVRPDVLRDGRPPAPQAVGALLLALRRAGAAAVAAPACGGCGRESLPSVRGSSWRCARCAYPPRRCAGCGREQLNCQRDATGAWRCPRCLPTLGAPDWAGMVDAVRGIDPSADPQVVLDACRRAASRLTQQRSLATAVITDPGLLCGRGAQAPAAAVLRLIDLLVEAGVAGIVRPCCPRCGRVVALVKWDAGARICQRCDRHLRATACTRCGRVREVKCRDTRGRPVCGGCSRRDPANIEQCVHCGRVRPVRKRGAEGPSCPTCPTPEEAVCALCGHTAPCQRSALTGQPRCRSCMSRRVRCTGCGTMAAAHSGTLDAPLCALCTTPLLDATRRRPHACPACGRPGPVAGECPHCRLTAIVRPLLSVGEGVHPKLLPLVEWWEGTDRPSSVRRWLARRKGARDLLRALADGTVAISHHGLDQVEDTRIARYIRRLLVACGVLPAHDEQLDRLQRWLTETLAAVGDVQQRCIVYRYIHWHHLRRLRARTSPGTPLTAAQAENVRNYTRAAIAVLDTIACDGRCLADLQQADLDGWLAEGRVAGRHQLGAFLRWAHREQLTTVTLPVTQWAGPRGRVDHEQRWAQARRLLHDETLPAEVRIAGLLVVLYAQPATRIRTLRFDQIHTAAHGARIVFGTTPIDLPPALAALISKLTADREGTERAATPWVFPGRPWTQPISADMLRERLTAIGIPARTARTTALFQMASELPAAVLARCLGIDVSSAVTWQRAAAGDWQPYAARTASGHPGPGQ
jgi:hypothetical protein